MQRLSKQAPPVLFPGLLVAAARQSIKQATTRGLRRHGLSSPQFWLLVALHEQPGPSLRELAARRLMDSPTASRIVGRLARRGLVRIEADPGDRRRRSIHLTARGAALARQLAPRAGELRRAIVAGFSETEVGALRRLLRRVVDNMERFEKRERAGAGRRAARRRT